METSNSTDDKRHLLGACFNLAWLNAEKIILEAAGKYKTDIVTDKDGTVVLATAKALIEKEGMLPYQKESILIHLIQHLPFAEHLLDKNKNEQDKPDSIRLFSKKLCEMLELLNAMRNYHTHYWHEEIKRTDTEPYTYKKDGMEKQGTRPCPLFQRLDEIYRIAIKETKEKRFGINKETGKKDTLFIASKEQKYGTLSETTIEQAFAHFEKSNNQSQGTQPKSIRYLFKEKKTQLNHNGILLLTCLFLEKDDACKLIAQFYGNQNGLAFEATYWVFTHFCCKLPQQKLQHTIAIADTRQKELKESLLLQMVAELGKCPNEIYPFLDKAKQQECIDLRETRFDDNLGKELQLTNSQQRFEDKFADLALRYLDEVCNFPNLHFQVCLGNFVMTNNEQKKSKNKNLLQYNFERKIHENVRVFDKLSNCDSLLKLKQQCDSNHEDAADTVFDETRWEPFAPLYDIRNNQIAIKLSPYPFAHLWKKDPNLRTRNDKDSNSFQTDIAFLSIYELPHLVYLAINEKNDKVEELIKEKINETRTLFKKIEDGKETPPLGNKNIPSCFTNQETKMSLEERIRERIKKETEEIETLRNEYIKEKTIVIRGREQTERQIPRGKVGTVATWLAHDMINNAHKDVREKIRNYHFNTLQTDLAKFRYFKGEIIDLCRLLGIINNPQAEHNHPFLCKLLSNGYINDITSLFENYLNERKKELDHNTQTLSSINNELPNKIRNELCNYFRISPDINHKEKASRLLCQPANLPRGLFNERLKKIVKEKYSNSGRDLESLFERPGSFSLSKALFELDKDNKQTYYNWERNYFDPTEKDEEKITINQLYSDNAQHAYDRKKTPTGKKAADNEKQIRRILLQDTVMLQMIRKIGESFLNDETNKQFGTMASVRLNDMFLTKEQRKAEESKTENIERHVLSKYYDFAISLHDKKITARLRLKELGQFRHLMKDTRLENLLPYFTKETIPYEDIRNELEHYERVQIQLIKEVQELEQQLHDPKDEAEAKQGHLRHSEYYIPKMIKKLTDITKIDQKILAEFFPGKVKQFLDKNNLHNSDSLLMLSIMLLIRNKFAHNQFIPMKTK